MKNSRISVKKLMIRGFVSLALVLSLVAVPVVASLQTAAAASKTDKEQNEEVKKENIAYELVSYKIRTTVNKDHSFDVKATIEVNLSDDTDSLVFVLPSGNFLVQDFEFEDMTAKVSTESGRRYLNILGADDLSKGSHTYKFGFTINEFAERNDEYDMFYYDALLPEWKVPIGKIDIKVSFPADFPWEDMQYYGGQFGIGGKNTKLKYKANEAAKTVEITGERIPENYSVTVKAQLPDGYWQGALDSSSLGYLIAGIMLLVVGASFILWLIGGKDPKFRKTKERRPIEGVAPSDITYIYEGKVRFKDIIALILYMATKGYIRISEYEPKKYKLYRVEDPKNEERYVRSAFNTLFEGVYQDRAIDMDDMGTRLRRVVNNAKYDIEAGYADKSMASRTTKSKYFRIACIAMISLAVAAIPVLTSLYQYLGLVLTSPLIAGVLTAFALTLICLREDSKYDIDSTHYAVTMAMGIALYASVVGGQLWRFFTVSGLWHMCVATFLLAMLAMFLCVIMTARGRGNAELTMRLNQLRKFIYHAKPADVEPLYREDKNYYYEMLPYAFIFLGMESWAKAFTWLDVPAPEWYSNDMEGYAVANLNRTPTAVDYARNVKSFARTMEDSYNAMIRHHRRG